MYLLQFYSAINIIIDIYLILLNINPSMNRYDKGDMLKQLGLNNDSNILYNSGTLLFSINCCFTDRFEWKHTSLLLGESEVTITWDIPQTQAPGTYRIQYFGDAKSLDQKISSFTGKSTDFKVMTPKEYIKHKHGMPKSVNRILKKNWQSLYKNKYRKTMSIVNKKH